MSKYVFVTGGVLSGLGKGITTSSIGLLLKSRGIKVTVIKIDPYLNCDAGTMNPYQHGEVFVLEDGSELDLDFGNYERFLDLDLTGEHNITTGKVYLKVIERERRGDYLGQTVQIIPHVTDEIKQSITTVAERSGAEVTIVELGGTVGDIESMPFLEAVRQLQQERGSAHCAFVHTTLVPILGPVGEQKTKPTQQSVREIRAIGIQPDIIIGRSEEPLKEHIKEKIALFCSVPVEAVISSPTAQLVYQVPLTFEEQSLTELLMEKLRLAPLAEDLTAWRAFLDHALHPQHELTVALVGKYTELADSYLSYTEALIHAGAELRTAVNIKWIEAEEFAPDLLEDVAGVIVPGGFGERGTKGKLQAIRLARERGLPFLGICLGFQLAVVEFARNVLGYKQANSTEIDPQANPAVIDLLPEQRGVKEKGGTMRLGASPVLLEPGSLAHRLYGREEVSERHRHRYEVNPEFVAELEAGGLRFSGRSPDGRMEIGELPGHPFFIASQFHPEFKSRPTRPHPLFLGFLKACRARGSS
ncbi:MAG: CTP synthase (glutamine hydrolyzing) [Candidatus Acetothermia bacterium]|jgi:CTP synthase|nr:CTP synthase (glutamine hydrolyzing) [Candidatus Acetothermia bacterium]MDH7505358.1 CTP synthase (glutamine hydrolyzing) [Candidatus Acetothermia bacterium]